MTKPTSKPMTHSRATPHARAAATPLKYEDGPTVMLIAVLCPTCKALNRVSDTPVMRLGDKLNTTCPCGASTSYVYETPLKIEEK